LKIRQQTLLIFLVALWIGLFSNNAFFKHLFEIYPFSDNIIFDITVIINSILFMNLVFLLFSSKYTTKPLLILMLLTAAFSNYFMTTYDVVIDHSMIENAVETSMKESLDLFSLNMVLYILFLFVLPSIFIYFTPLQFGSLKMELKRKAQSFILSLLVIVITIVSQGDYYATFFREHKQIRYYATPTFQIYSVKKFIKEKYFHKSVEFQHVAMDAKIDEPIPERELIVMVVGETARADRFSLNGYAKQTNPLLEQEDIINFPQVSSCGTATAKSVPCMFSLTQKKDYDSTAVRNTDNVLDILKRSGVNVLWRDNNSDSKGVALRVDYEDFQSSDTNPICDIECRDEGMLSGLQEYINTHPKGDIMIVLHQMGNHGPAYYKRYPKRFEKFTPVCTTNQLEECSKEEIDNAYDNAILYTDYFLKKVIDLLKRNNDFETAMVYMSDHGESLGEHGIYLHGMPDLLAPIEQTHVPSVLWFGDKVKGELKVDELKANSKNSYSQDNLSHTLLGLFEVQSEYYKKELDILEPFRKEED